MVVDEHTGHGQKVSNLLTGTDQENQKYPRRRVVIGSLGSASKYVTESEYDRNARLVPA